MTSERRPLGLDLYRNVPARFNNAFSSISGGIDGQPTFA